MRMNNVNNLSNLRNIKIKFLERRKFCIEILVRCFLLFLYLILVHIPPFHKEILPQEEWLYSYPNVPRYIPGRLFYPFIICAPLCAIWWFYKAHGDDLDVFEGFLCLTLSLSLTLLLVEILKNITGRPRPNFLAICFPNGELPRSLICNTGTFYDLQCRKSFPSGHAALIFSSMTFLSFYLGGKMRLFSSNSEIQGVKLFIFLFPFILATVMALSAISDYHHHWEDVFVGSLVGFAIAWICYHLYFPKITTPYSDFCNKMVYIIQTLLQPLTELQPTKEEVQK